MSGEAEVADTLDLCLRIGELLMSNGAGAADVTVTMDSLGRHFALRNAEIDVTFTHLSMAYREGPGAPTQSLLRQVKRRTVDFDELTTVDHLVTDILGGEADLSSARDRVSRIGSTARQRKRWAVTLGWGAMSAGVAVLLGAGPFVVAVATVAALVIERLQSWLDRRRLPVFYAQVGGGLVAVVFAIAVSFIPVTADPSLVVSANIVMLLSGVGFVGALQDALSGFPLTATARLLEAVLSTAGIIAGVAGGLALASVIGAPIGTLSPGYSNAPSIGPLALIVVGTGSALAAAGYAFAARARKRILGPLALLAGVSIVAARLVERVGFGRMFAVALAAFIVGLLAYPIARRYRVPPLVVVISGVVPFLPGLTIYQSLTLLASGQNNVGPDAQSVAAGILSMVVAASIALSLAAGVILGEYVSQPLARESRRLERRLAGPRLVGPIRRQAVRTGRRDGRHRAGNR